MMTNESAILGLLAEKQAEIYNLRAYIAQLEQGHAQLQGEIAELVAEIALTDRPRA